MAQLKPILAINGASGSIGLCGSNDAVAANNETIGTVVNDRAETVSGSGNTISENFSGVSVAVSGDSDAVSAVAGTATAFAGVGESFTGSNDSVTLANGTASVSLAGNADTIGSAFAGNAVDVSGQDDTLSLSGGQITLDDGSTSVLVAGSGDTVSSDFAGDTFGIAGLNDTAQVSGGMIDVAKADAASLSIDGAGNSVTAVSGAAPGLLPLSGQTIGDIDAIYNAVLCRDPVAADLASAQVLLGMGGTLGQLQAQLANSAEAQADMASTYAVAAGSGPMLALLDAQPQSTGELLNTGNVQAQNTDVPSAQEFATFADAMSNSYGAPIELFSVDPLTGAETELADTSITNLLAELPVLETQANGVNLGLQLADGTQV